MKKSKKSSITFNDLLIHVSGEYLTDNFPEHLSTMSQEEIEDYIQKHVWEAVEDMEPKDIWLLIESGAYALFRFLQSKGISVRK